MKFLINFDHQPQSSDPRSSGSILSPRLLRQQNDFWRHRGGVSAENCTCGFVPAFKDTETGNVYLSCFHDGRPAPVHVLDGLPDDLVLARGVSGIVSQVKSTVMAGFVRCNRFYTRDEAAQALN